MSRLVNTSRRKIEYRPENAGNILVFCEGTTEVNYIQYLKEYLERHSDYSSIVIVPINTSGNAMNVYKKAEKFLEDEENAAKYFNYEKHLMFDCDAPNNIQEVIQLMEESENDYVLDYSNLLFETWLVMHFRDLSPQERCDKNKIIELIKDYLGLANVKYSNKQKADPNTIVKILTNDGNNAIRNAIKNAKALQEYWKKQGKDISKDIVEMNPSVGLHDLIERIIDEIDYRCK